MTPHHFSGLLSACKAIAFAAALLPVQPEALSQGLSDALRIKIELGSYSDETVIRFTPDASKGYDACCDAWNIFVPESPAPDLFSKNNCGGPLSIQSLPAFTGADSADLFLKADVAGTYTLSAEEPGPFDRQVRILLNDLETGAQYDLRSGKKFILALPPRPATAPSRFRIRFLTYKNKTAGTVKHTSGDAARFRIELESNSTRVALQPDTLARINSLSVISKEGSSYLCWKTAGQKEDGYYLVYRSADSTHYECVGKKQGTGVPIAGEVAYYFKDKFSSPGPVQYRVVHISRQNTFLTSEAITVLPDAAKAEVKR